VHIDPKGTIGGFPALLVRRALRQLRGPTPWDVADLEAATGLTAAEAAALLKLLRAEGLIQAAGHGTWGVSQAGQTLSSASAARPVTRATAEQALAQFMERVAWVNRDPYFLAKANRVVLFGSMLRSNVERLSDVDLAVELVEKETDSDRARVKNEQRVEELAAQGRHFRGILEAAACWYLETFRFLKGGSRVIALADYRVEKKLVLAVPHRFLLGVPEEVSAASTSPQPTTRRRRPRWSPF
jgi:predicted nucleotidyltransferase